MTDRDRYDESLIPEWAGPVYFWVAAIVMGLYLPLDLFAPLIPGLSILKATGPVLLGIFALFRGAPFLAVALFLSAGGDYSLALDPPQLERGILFFGGAHVAYIIIFISLILQGGWRREGWIPAGILGLFGLAMLWWIQPGLGSLALPVTAYNAIILLMAITACFVKGSRLLLLGAVLFVISDSLIAARWFREVMVFHYPDWGGALVWITYAGAQLLLAKGVVESRREEAD